MINHSGPTLLKMVYLGGIGDRVFLGHWKKEISECKPQHLPTNRAAFASFEVFDKWFEEMVLVDKLF